MAQFETVSKEISTRYEKLFFQPKNNNAEHWNK